ncbi:hypothetical protein D3C83_301360 [compost metagenome]
MIVIEQRDAMLGRRRQRVLAEERRLVRQTQQSEHGRREVDLRHQIVHAPRREVLR